MGQWNSWNSGTAVLITSPVCVYVCVYIHRVCVHTNFRILLFRCSSCSINRGILYVYNREGVIIIFFYIFLWKNLEIRQFIRIFAVDLEPRTRSQEQGPNRLSDDNT